MRDAVAPAGALYVGEVVHRRVGGFAHRLRYRVYMLLLDVDRIETVRPRLLGRGRFGLIGWRSGDHGDGSERPLRAQIQAHLAAVGVALDGGAIRLLTMPRVLGYGFNPICVYFCHGPGGDLRALVHEVTNTFGERHSYVIPAAVGPDGIVRQSVAKAHFVSPFMDMALDYAFTVRPPGEDVSVSIAVRRGLTPVLTASFAGDRRPLTDAALMRVLLTHALLTFKVTWGIHWEALLGMLKGSRYRHRGPTPKSPITAGEG